MSDNNQLKEYNEKELALIMSSYSFFSEIVPIEDGCTFSLGKRNYSIFSASKELGVDYYSIWSEEGEEIAKHYTSLGLMIINFLENDRNGK